MAETQANALRVQHVERCFGAGGQPLYKKGRVLLGEGVLTKICRKQAQPRQFFLFNDVLVLGHIVQDKKKYAKQQLIPLSGINIIQLPDTEKIQNAWQISSAKKSFTVFAATPREKQEWMQHLARASGTAVISGPDERAEGHAPIWTPDSMADVCMCCKKTRFSALQRRHHCRQCGMVVCAACSRRKFLLPKQSDKAQRVCDICYDKLSDSASASPASRSRPNSQNGPPMAGGSDTEDDEDDDDETEGAENMPEAQARQAELSREMPTHFYKEGDGEQGAAET